jgi:hypothetical protein
MKKLILLVMALFIISNYSFAEETIIFKNGKIDTKIYFDYSSDKLHSSYFTQLDIIGYALKTQFKNKNLKIIGFADRKGTKDNNLAFSKRRAENIKEYLVHWHNINPNRIKTVAMGFVNNRFEEVKNNTITPKTPEGIKRVVKDEKEKQMYADLEKFDKEDADLNDTFYFEPTTPDISDERGKDRVVIFELE